MIPSSAENQVSSGPGESSEQVVAIDLDWRSGYRFEATFETATIPILVIDEPPPLGGGTGPNPSHLLTLAVASCLSASLLFALRKFKQQPGTLRTHAVAWPVRNERKRLRIGHIEVAIRLGATPTESKGLERAIAQFEDFCVVTQSVRAAIPVQVQVFDGKGTLLGP